ncbi:hypothetical protein [Pedobacter helvus]|uniref:Uncharacterized protein n=1 Tax=Pedobacter helvus TaxID=2563444 RepID=A0ABW9JPH0_9SPHI|nr:hypothetical protein [Pedobacter ureilyticus]
MNQIKTLADELRETIKKDGNSKSASKSKGLSAKREKPSSKNAIPIDPSVEKLFESMLSYDLTGKEKLLIRLDDRTVFLLKQLKIAKSIDMNKLIAYSLQYFLNQHPELIQYIKQNIKTIEL